MVLHNPNNWHWVSKNASAWTREYLDKELIGTSVEENGVSAKIDKVISMEGDVDVSQRKGKVITLFDVQLQLEYGGERTLRPPGRSLRQLWAHGRRSQARPRMTTKRTAP